MTNSEKQANNFIETAIKQEAFAKALRMIDEWEQDQENPIYADIAYWPEEIDRIEQATGADLSHIRQRGQLMQS